MQNNYLSMFMAKYDLRPFNILWIASLTSLICALLVAFYGFYGVIVISCVVPAVYSYLDVRRAIFIYMAMIILLPKINLIQVPGTYIAVRPEDFLLLFLTVAVLLNAASKRILLNVPKITFAIMLYILFTLISLLAGIYQGTIPNPLLGYLFFIRRIEYFLPLFIAYWAGQIDDLRYVDRLFTVTLVGTSFVSMLQYFNVIGGFFSGQYVPVQGRLFSTFSGPYEYAFYLSLVFSYYLAKYFRKGMRGHLSSLIMSAVSVIGLFFANARITIASIAVGLIILLGCYKRYALLFIMATILLSFVYLAPASVQGRFATVFKGNTIAVLWDLPESARPDIIEGINNGLIAVDGFDNTLASRYSQWVGISEKIKRYPIFGSGPAAFGEGVDLNYIRIIGENGFLGFASFLIMIWMILASSYKNMWNQVAGNEVMQYSAFIFIALIGFLINALFSAVFEASKAAILFWFLVGIYYRMISAKAVNGTPEGRKNAVAS